MKLKPVGKVSIGIGVFAVFLGVGMLGGRRWKQVEPGTVVGCQTHSEHGTWADIALRDGRNLSLGWEDIGYPERCLATGTRLEKKSGEYAFLVNGVAHEWPNQAVFTNLLYVGIGLIAVGVIFQLPRRSLPG